MLPIAVIAAIALAIDRRFRELAVLIASVAIAFVGVHEIKDAVDRPRPPAGDVLGGVSARGSSFPSAMPPTRSSTRGSRSRSSSGCDPAWPAERC